MALTFRFNHIRPGHRLFPVPKAQSTSRLLHAFAERALAVVALTLLLPELKVLPLVLLLGRVFALVAVVAIRAVRAAAVVVVDVRGASALQRRRCFFFFAESDDSR